MHLSNFEARAHGLVHVSAWHHSSRYAQSFQDEAETANHAFFSFHSQGVTKTNRLQIVLGIRKILRVVLKATINANNYSTLVLGRKFMEYTSLPNLISFVSFLVY